MVTMERPLKITWASDYWAEGNAYGYSTHNSNMRKHVAQVPGVELCDDAPAVVTIASADKFEPVPGKVNFLFSMFEAEDLPPSYRRKLPLADHLIVPCQQNKRVFEKYTPLPVSVCTEGVDVQRFKFKRRKRGLPFRVLWVGAPNPRKGYEEMIALADLIKGLPGIELYLKTTVTNKLERQGNIIFDSRNLSLDELVSLYHSAHLFVLPSRGEGFGLTLAEAMATGAPCIATRYGGPEDFFSGAVGYPVNYRLKPVEMPSYDLRTAMAFADVEHLAGLVMHVLKNYNQAARKGAKAAMHIRARQTWPQAARRLVEIVRGHMEQVEHGRNAA